MFLRSPSSSGTRAILQVSWAQVRHGPFLTKNFQALKSKGSFYGFSVEIARKQFSTKTVIQMHLVNAIFFNTLSFFDIYLCLLHLVCSCMKSISAHLSFAHIYSKKSFFGCNWPSLKPIYHLTAWPSSNCSPWISFDIQLVFEVQSDYLN